MYSFNEIVARLVIVAGVVVIVETRARYIYLPGPFFECMEMKVPCGGRTEASCNEYCEDNEFASGTCSGHCCFCFARDGLLPQTTSKTPRQQTVDHRSLPSINSIFKLENKELTASSPLDQAESVDSTPKPKRALSGNAGNKFSLATSKLHTEVSRSKKDALAEDNDVCLTPDCLKTANAILDNLDESVNPCDDFYQFTCGHFQKEQPIPDDKGSLTLMGSLTDKLVEQLREVLEDKQAAESLSHSGILVKNVYDSCMNSDLLEAQGITPMVNLLKTFGGWPVIEGEKWNSKTAPSWQKTVADFRKSGLATDYLLKISVAPDLKNPSLRILSVTEPILAFSREQLHNPIFLDAYHKYQVKVAVLFGANKAQAEQEMAEVFQFEKTLANISIPRELARSHPLRFFHPMTISQLQERFPSVQWSRYVTALLPKDVPVDENQVINVNLPEQLTVLLNLIDKTDKRVLANYLMWRATSAVLPYLNQDAIQTQQGFLGAISGQKQRKPRWRECVDVVSATLGQAVGSMYVRRHFDESSRESAIEMVNDIKSAFIDILTTMDWMDEDTKKQAFEKAAAMKTKIGYPEEILDEKILAKLYKGLEVKSDDFFGNLLNLTKGSVDFAMKKLKQPVDKNDWLQFGKPAVVNAFYQPTTNSIQFPAGILQGHFFDKNRPNFMNYGAIGWVIGHEITHGFDDQGSHFDLNGELQDWWNPRTKHLFHEKAKCLVNQYGSFTYTDLVRNVTIPINGIVSLGENIADNGGIKQAYQGYQAWVQRNGPEKRLPGLNYTPNQLFWIGAANNWCSKVRPQQMVESIQMGVHSPGEYRVRGTFANMEQFSRDFNCPSGTRMNPTSKCTVW